MLKSSRPTHSRPEGIIPLPSYGQQPEQFPLGASGEKDEKDEKEPEASNGPAEGSDGESDTDKEHKQPAFIPRIRFFDKTSRVGLDIKK